MRTTIINAQYIKDNSGVIPSTYDNNDLTPFIIQAEDRYIKPLTQKVLFSAILANTTGYTTLINDFIAPCLLNYSIYLALPSIQSKISNTNLATRNPGNSNPLDYNLYKDYRAEILKNAEFYAIQLKDELEENYLNDNKYDGDGSNDDVKPYNCGIAFY